MSILGGLSDLASPTDAFHGDFPVHHDGVANSKIRFSAMKVHEDIRFAQSSASNRSRGASAVMRGSYSLQGEPFSTARVDIDSSNCFCSLIQVHVAD